MPDLGEEVGDAQAADDLASLATRNFQRGRVAGRPVGRNRRTFRLRGAQSVCNLRDIDHHRRGKVDRQRTSPVKHPSAVGDQVYPHSSAR